MASLSTCHLGLWLGWQFLLNLVKLLCGHCVEDLSVIYETGGSRSIESASWLWQLELRVSYIAGALAWRTSLSNQLWGVGMRCVIAEHSYRLDVVDEHAFPSSVFFE